MNWKLIRKIDTWLGIPLILLTRCFSRSSASGGTRSGNSSPSRILLIKFWGIGNLFMILPSVQALHRRYPSASIDFLTLENNRAALGMTESIDGIYTIDTSSSGQFIRSTLRAIRSLKDRQYDIIIDFEQFARFSALLAHMIGGAHTIGYYTKGQHRHHLYGSSVAYDNDIHITRSFYNLAEAAGVTEPFSADNLLGHLGKWQQNGLRMLGSMGIPAGSPVAVMHIGTSENFKERRWPSENFASLTDGMIERYGFRVILTGLPEEQHLIRQTMSQIGNKNSVVDLGGRLSFAEYFSLITAADILISADTAAVHLASAANTPVVGLYGPNSPHLYGPWGANGQAIYADYDCSPCITNFNGKINRCRHPSGRGDCMKALTVGKVAAAVHEICADICVPSRMSSP